jgi:hypothetical protein
MAVGKQRVLSNPRYRKPFAHRASSVEQIGQTMRSCLMPIRLFFRQPDAHTGGGDYQAPGSKQLGPLRTFVARRAPNNPSRAPKWVRAVIISAISKKLLLQTVFFEDNHSIQALASNAVDEALDIGSLLSNPDYGDMRAEVDAMVKS